MKTESDVIEKFSQDISNRLIKNSIKELIEIKDFLSAHDTELENVWEEICVQIQLEESCFWESYDLLTVDIISSYVSKLKLHEILAIWFQTDEGSDWLLTPILNQEYFEIEDLSNNCEFRTEAESPPVSLDHISKYIQKRIYERAEIYSNKRIRNFLKRY